MTELERRIEDSIKLSSNYDPDRQYMAIKDLSDVIEAESNKIGSETLLRMIDTILRFLDDENKGLQGTAGFMQGWRSTGCPKSSPKSRPRETDGSARI